MGEKKTDSSEIIEFIDNLERKHKKSDRSFWPKFIFHYTPLETAIKILRDGKLKSRFDLESSNELLMSVGSREILNQTNPEKKKFVRLYFRPRTPPQFLIEGIRPKDKISSLNAHCPIPIFFLFDSRKLLTSKETRFTNGNYSKRDVQVGNNIEFLNNLPFDNIYHIGPYNIHLNSEIKFYRCAEVLYPRELDLKTLRFICCRSEAEKDTLLNLLPSKILSDWYDKIIISRTRLFEGKWTYLEKVKLLNNKILLYFSPDSITPGPFMAKLKITNLNTNKIIEIKREKFYTNIGSYFEAIIPEKIGKYMAELFLDEYLVYSNEYSEQELPF